MDIFDVQTHASGPTGRLPLEPDFLTSAPSGDVFGWTQDAAMGWNPSDIGKDEYLMLSTQGGIRAEDGSPIALGYHTGHYEVGLLAQAAAREFKAHNKIPFAGFVGLVVMKDALIQGKTNLLIETITSYSKVKKSTEESISLMLKTKAMMVLGGYPLVFGYAWLMHVLVVK